MQQQTCKSRAEKVGEGRVLCGHTPSTGPGAVACVPTHPKPARRSLQSEGLPTSVSGNSGPSPDMENVGLGRRSSHCRAARPGPSRALGTRGSCGKGVECKDSGALGGLLPGAFLNTPKSVWRGLGALRVSQYQPPNSSRGRLGYLPELNGSRKDFMSYLKCFGT